MRLFFVPVLLSLFVAGCGSQSAKAPEVQHHYLKGKVVALNAKDQTASVDGEAIPGWMGAMTMEYPIQSKDEFKSLHVGERIQATINDRGDGDYDLSNIQKQAPGK